MITLDKIEAAHFEKHLGQIFQAEAGDYTGTWELIAITPLGPSRAERDAGRNRPFSLEFKAPVEPRLPQCIYTITHPALGALDIFVVPIRVDKDGYYLEAVFN